MATKKVNLTSAFDLFPKSADLVWKNINVFGILFLLPFLATLASAVNYGEKFDDKQWSSGGFGFGGLPTYAAVGLVGFGILVFVAVVIISFLVEAMTTTAELEAAQGKKLTLKHLFDVGKKFWLRLFGFYVLYGLLIIGGLILLIVPGLIILRRYVLAPYILIDKNLTIGEAMKRSAELTKPHSGDIWSIIGVSLLIALTGVVPIIGGLISFVLGALYTVAFALRYQELK